MSIAAYCQQTVSAELSLAVKESGVWKSSFTTPDFSYYNRNYNEVFEGQEYTFDMLSRDTDMIYVDNDKFYSNTYVPIFLQQQYSGLQVQDYYIPDKTYSIPDPRDITIMTTR